MSIINSVHGIFHHIRVKLYPNYLPKGGKMVARTVNDALIDVEKVCAAMKDRGGFNGSYKDLVDNVRAFLDEAVYQLCDGYGLNLDYFSIQPNIGGTFNSVKESHNREKHPITFRFRVRPKMRDIVDHIQIDIDGKAQTEPFIDKFIYHREHLENCQFKPGAMFSISGYKIKAWGDDPGCGVFFVPVDNPSAAAMVTEFSENRPSKITGIAPDTGYTKNRIEIRTQYTGSKTNPLKAPRVITSSFVLETAA